MNNIIPFIRWAFRKIFSKIARINSKFHRMLDYDRMFALLTWLICSIGLVLGIQLVFIIPVGPGTPDQGTIKIAQFAYKYSTYSCIAYLIYSVIAVMYNNYQDEQDEFISKLKGK